jgi:hypothetical protein
MEPARWAFATAPTTPRHPHVLLIAFSTGPLAGGPAPSGAEVRTIHARQDLGWFAGWRSGSLRAIAERDLGGALAALDAADHLHLVAVAPEAPADLTYLQAAWAVIDSLVARGATTVLDVHAMTYRPASALAAAGSAFDVRREVRIVFETSAERPDGAHALHTRGMRKFGAPDLVALCSDGDVEAVGAVMTELMTASAGGADLRTGPLDLGATSWHLISDLHGLGGLLQLGNEARVLVDSHGVHLMGIAARLRPPTRA